MEIVPGRRDDQPAALWLIWPVARRVCRAHWRDWPWIA
jgi:hypothetical protein